MIITKFNYNYLVARFENIELSANEWILSTMIDSTY